MTQQAIDFVVKTFALAFASIITLMGMTIFLVALFQGDGEAQRIVNDLTTPFLGVLGSLVAAFLGHWFFVIRQGASASGTPNSAFNRPVRRAARARLTGLLNALLHNYRATKPNSGPRARRARHPTHQGRTGHWWTV